jgi:hypothetical protein
MYPAAPVTRTFCRIQQLHYIQPLEYYFKQVDMLSLGFPTAAEQQLIHFGEVWGRSITS